MVGTAKIVGLMSCGFLLGVLACLVRLRQTTRLRHQIIQGSRGGPRVGGQSGGGGEPARVPWERLANLMQGSRVTRGLAAKVGSRPGLTLKRERLQTSCTAAG